MTTTNTGNQLFLSINPGSQLAKLLQRLSAQPTMRTADLCATWQQKARDGGTTELSGSRAAFLLDALGEAVEGQWPEKTGRGEVTIKGVSQALLAAKPDGLAPIGQGSAAEAVLQAEIDELRRKLATEHESAANFAAQLEQREGELREARARVTVAAEKVVVKGDKGSEKSELLVPTIFPEPPVNRAGMGARFIKPEWFDDMAEALDSGRHVSIAGPPGPGKSTAPEEYFISRDIPFVVVNAEGGMRRRDLEGTKEIAPGRSFFQTAEFAAAAIFGWGCIVNEVNAAEPDALLLINGVIEVPHKITVNGKTYDVSPKFRLVVTYNPGLAGTKPLPPAFKDRFFPIKLGFVSDDFLRKMLVVHGMPAGAPYAARMIAFAKECWNVQANGGMRYQISPRRLFDAVFLIEGKRRLSLRAALEKAVLAAVDANSDAQVLAGIVAKF